MKFIAALGTSELCAEEIKSYLGKYKQFNVISKKADYPFIVLEGEEPDIKKLGGALRICKVLEEKNTEDVLFPFKKKRKPEWNVNGDYEGVSVYFFSRKQKNRINERDLINYVAKNVKAKCIPKRDTILEPSYAFRKELQGNEMCVFVDEKKTYFTVTTQIHDSDKEKEKWDSYCKPKKWKYAMRPRLARMLVNLTGKHEGVLLDPFCGIGTVLGEANSFQRVGRDLNPEAIECCKKNVEGDIEVGDATKLKVPLVDCIVSEPYLGPSITQKPSPKEAKQILRELNELYFKCFNEFKRVLKKDGVIVFIFPAIQSQKVYECDIPTITEGLKIKKEFYHGDRDHQVVLRHVVVLSKV